MSFCLFILTDAYENKLSDDVEINDQTWAELKQQAMKPDYLADPDIVSFDFPFTNINKIEITNFIIKFQKELNGEDLELLE